VPTYQYACTECDHAFEQVQSFTDDALTVCPQCQGRLRKVFNAVGVVFKGSGFYRTDSRAGEASEKSAAKSGEKSDKSTEKPAAKSEKSGASEKSPAAASSSSSTAAAS
jgi:putative FmdB family regulatory protein